MCLSFMSFDPSTCHAHLLTRIASLSDLRLRPPPRCLLHVEVSRQGEEGHGGQEEEEEEEEEEAPAEMDVEHLPSASACL